MQQSLYHVVLVHQGTIRQKFRQNPPQVFLTVHAIHRKTIGMHHQTFNLRQPWPVHATPDVKAFEGFPSLGKRYLIRGGSVPISQPAARTPLFSSNILETIRCSTYERKRHLYRSTLHKQEPCCPKQRHVCLQRSYTLFHRPEKGVKVSISPGGGGHAKFETLP